MKIISHCHDMVANCQLVIVLSIHVNYNNYHFHYNIDNQGLNYVSESIMIVNLKKKQYCRVRDHDSKCLYKFNQT